jgi:hypothetical protein
VDLHGNVSMHQHLEYTHGYLLRLGSRSDYVSNLCKTQKRDQKRVTRVEMRCMACMALGGIASRHLLFDHRGSVVFLSILSSTWSNVYLSSHPYSF